MNVLNIFMDVDICTVLSYTEALECRAIIVVNYKL